MYKTLICFLCFFMISQNVFAHSPSNIKISYNKADNKIDVRINHRVSRGGKSQKRRHYIKEVSLQLNEETPDLRTFKRQQNTRIVNVSFSIPQNESDDVLLLKVIGNKGQETTRTIPISDLPKYQKTKEASSY